MVRQWLLVALFGLVVVSALPRNYDQDLEEDDDDDTGNSSLDSSNSIPLPVRTGVSAASSATSLANSLGQKENSMVAAAVGGAIGAGYGLMQLNKQGDLEKHLTTAHSMKYDQFLARVGEHKELTKEHIESVFGLTPESAKSVIEKLKLGSGKDPLSTKDLFDFIAGEDGVIQEQELLQTVYGQTEATANINTFFAKAFLTGYYYAPSARDIIDPTAKKIAPLRFIPREEYMHKMGGKDRALVDGDYAKLKELIGFGEPEEWKATLAAAKGTEGDVVRLWNYLSFDVAKPSLSIFSSPEKSLVISFHRLFRNGGLDGEHHTNQVKVKGH